MHNDPTYSTSRLAGIEQKLNEIFKGVMTFSLSLIKPKAALIAAQRYESPDSMYDKPIGIFARNLLDEKAGMTTYNTLSMANLWTTEKYSGALKQNWDTPSKFFFELSASAKEFHRSKTKANLADSEKSSVATKAILDSRERKVKSFQLYSNWSSVDEQITSIDKEFLYSHLRKDDTNNLYWVFDNGCITLIPMQDSSHGRRISDDGEFWTNFINDNKAKIKEYSRLILEKAYELQAEGTFDSENDVDSLEERIEEIVPHCISRQLCIQLTFVKVGSGKTASWLFESFSLAMAGTKPSLNRDNWCAVLQVDLLKFLDMNYVAYIRQWKNSTTKDTRDSIYSIDTSYVEYGRNVTKMPTLPSAFKNFMNGKLVNPIMGLLRIATFTTSVIDDNNYSRQSLLIVGEGKEGKGVFCKLLEYIFGKSFVTLQEGALDVNNKFGLMPAINKRLICLQDVKYPTNVIESPMFKSVTGCDTVSVDRKFMDPLEWHLDGTKILIVTNKRVWLNNEYAITRVLPVFFQKNYDPMDVVSVHDITSDLCAEYKEFIQWCYDYVAYFKQLTNAKGEPWKFNTKNGLLLISDEQFKLWKKGILEETYEGHWKNIQKDAFEAESSPDSSEVMFRVSQYETETEYAEEFYKEIADKLFVIDGETETKRTSLVCAILKATYNPASLPELVAIGITRVITPTRDKSINSFINWLSQQEGVSKKTLHSANWLKGVSIKNPGASIVMQKPKLDPYELDEFQETML